MTELGTATAQKATATYGGLDDAAKMTAARFGLCGLAAGVMLSAWYVPVRPAHDVAGAHGTGLAGHLKAINKQRKRRNAADLIARTQRLLRLSVNLGHPHVGLQLGGSLHVARGHLPARAAPRRPKVHQQRDLVALQVLVKRGLSQVDRLASEQRLLALPAVGRAGKLVRTHPVGGVAMGADDVQGFAHTV